MNHSLILENDGFVRLNSFFDPETIKKAHSEIKEWYAKDLSARTTNKVTEPHWNGPAGKTVLTSPSHLMIDAYCKSPTLDLLFEKMLTDPVAKKILEDLTGGNIKLRGYNIRRMTGAYNPAPAHEWHRDSLGEIGFGILLTDVEPDTNAATAFVPGSHLYPYCPRKNNIFYSAPSLHKFFQKYNFFSKQLGKKVLGTATGAHGVQGDAFIFINDIWHGREPNLNGKETIVVLIGAFPTDYEFPDAVTPPDSDILGKLPPTFSSVASCKLPPNQNTSTILKRMIAKRQPTGLFTLWRLAQVERRIYEIFSFVFVMTAKIINRLKREILYYYPKIERRLFRNKNREV